MQIVTDSGADMSLQPEQIAQLGIQVVPLIVTLDGKSYREDVDIGPEEFYHLLAGTDSLPTTSQPSAGDFAETYRRIAAVDADILSIHISSGLSGTYNSALEGAKLAPEADVLVFDSKTLSAVTGWQVEAAARAAQAGWEKERIVSMISDIGAASESRYTLEELKYLIHGGRISHMRGLIASMLNIKPLIGVEKVNGTYTQLGQTRTFTKALKGLVNLMGKDHKPGSALRVQVLHSFNPEGADALRQLIDQTYDCTWLPVGPMSLVLGAHTGPSMVGVAYAPADTFSQEF